MRSQSATTSGAASAARTKRMFVCGAVTLGLMATLTNPAPETVVTAAPQPPTTAAAAAKVSVSAPAPTAAGAPPTVHPTSRSAEPAAQSSTPAPPAPRTDPPQVERAAATEGHEWAGGCTVSYGTRFKRPMFGDGALRAGRVLSTGACAARCAAHPQCTVFEFSFSDWGCSMYTSPPGEERVSALSDVGRCPQASVTLSQWAPLIPAPTLTAQLSAATAITEPYLCKPAVSDHAAWRRRVQELPCSYAPSASFTPPLREALKPTWYCDKMANPISAWRAPRRTRPEDIAIGLYSGEGLFYTRASSCKDTYLSHFPKHEIYTSVNETQIYGGDTLPATELWELSRALRPWGEHTNAQLLQLYGLRHLVRKYPDAAWFFIGGDDTYLHPDFTRRLLDDYDPREPLWLANYPVRDRLGQTDAGRWVLRAASQEQLERSYPRWKSRHDAGAFEWASGATSWWLSRPAAEKFADAVGDFISNIPISKICYCPDVLSGLLLSLLGFRITPIPNHRSLMHAYAVDSKMVDHSDHGEVLLYHYVAPGRMIGIDQRVVHNKLDRLVNGGSMAAVVQYAREFIDVHRSVARRRQAQFDLMKSDAKATELTSELTQLETSISSGSGDATVEAFRRLVDAHYAALRKWQAGVVVAARAAVQKGLQPRGSLAGRARPRVAPSDIPAH